MLPRQAFLARLAASESDADVQAAVEDMRALVAVWTPLLREWRRTFVELDLEDSRRV